MYKRQEEIIQSVNDKSQQVDEDDDNVASVELEKKPTASEAFTCFDTTLKGKERQPECDHVLLLGIKRLWDKAARKRNSTSKQLTLFDMFNWKIIIMCEY